MFSTPKGNRVIEKRTIKFLAYFFRLLYTSIYTYYTLVFTILYL